MVAVQVMKSAVDEIVEVVAVRDAGMRASRVMSGRALDRRARRRVAVVDGEDVLCHARFARRVQVPVVEIIGVVAMPNRPMPTARPVLVGMPVPVLHGVSPSSSGSIGPRAARGQATGGRR